MENPIKIRVASPRDAEALLRIYTPYVQETAISFEYEPPSPAEFAGRMERVLQKYPYLAAEVGGTLLGYAYAGAFNERAAYDWGAETTIYVERSARKSGLGRALYTALERILTEQGILNLNACIGYPRGEDPYLTKNSVEFHRHLGFQPVGTFCQCGYKFGRWYDMMWMEKFIGDHAAVPQPIKRFDDVKASIREKYDIR